MEERRLIELLTRKLAGEASQLELIELAELLEKNPDLSHVEKVCEEIWDSNGADEDPDFFFKRHKRKYRNRFELSEGNENIARNVVSKPKRYRYLIPAMSILLFLALTCWLFYFRKKTSERRNYMEIISGKGVRKDVTLPDGTKVWLNADSRLSFDTRMKEKNHSVVNLSGEAFFDVVHHKNTAFEVRTRKVSVTVSGTAFNIKDYPNDKYCETTLIRGAIELVINNPAKPKFALTPFEKFSVTDKQLAVVADSDKGADSSSILIEYITPLKLGDKEYLRETSWTQNKLIFENEAFAELAPKLERWFNVKINITTRSSAQSKYTGAFANESIEQALSALKLIRPFNYSIQNKEITVY